jgi:2,3-bisphosphoglycerate-independent phosphoglycerate mutase
MKIIFILLDGIGDRSHRVLNYLTPLQSASTPNLDHLAEEGCNGLFHAASPGICLPSETAHYLIFGYGLDTFPGRGLLEAVGYGLNFDDRDVLCLAHLAGATWMEGIPVLTLGRHDIGGEKGEIEALYRAIATFESHDIRFTLNQTGPNDGILVMKGHVSPHISDSDPLVKGHAVAKIWSLKENPEPDQGEKSAEALNHYLSHCHRILSGHEKNRQREEKNLPPVNFLVTQRCGRRIRVEPFVERWGLRGMLISSGAVYAGIAHELGMTHVAVKDGGEPGADLRERIRLALGDDRYDFIHVHTKAPDEAAHRGDPRQKRDVIADLDLGLNELTQALKAREDLIVVVTADHSTPSESTLIHSGEPVPITMVGPKVRRDGVRSFDEVSSGAGCLGFLRGHELMLMALNYADRSPLHGHLLGPRHRPYRPEKYEPFKMVD